MKKDKKIILLFILTLAGLLFSGYMSGVKLFTSNCVFNEPCPYFLGFPACYFGFGMFLALFILATGMLVKSIGLKWIKLVLAISVIGIIFSGYFTLRELPVFFSSGFGAYVLGLPTCALGLIFYILILTCGVLILRKLKK